MREVPEANAASVLPEMPSEEAGAGWCYLLVTEYELTELAYWSTVPETVKARALALLKPLEELCISNAARVSTSDKRGRSQRRKPRKLSPRV